MEEAASKAAAPAAISNLRILSTLCWNAAAPVWRDGERPTAAWLTRSLRVGSGKEKLPTRKQKPRRGGGGEELGAFGRRPERASLGILLENYYLPGDLEAEIDAFVANYNHLRYHESIGNLTPADVYFRRGQTILMQRERIKRQTIQNRRLLHRRQAA